MQALDRSTGASVWKQDRLAERKIGGPQVVGDFVAVVDVEGYVHLLVERNGAYVGRLATDGTRADVAARAVPVEHPVGRSAGGNLYAVTAK